MTFEDKIDDIRWEYEDKIAALEAERAADQKAIRLETAQRMKADGMTMETILKYVELTEEEQAEIE